MREPSPPRRRLALKLIASILPIGIGVALLATLILVYAEYQHGVRGIDEEFRLIEEGRLAGITENLWVHDLERLRMEARGITRHPDVVGVVVRSQSGEPLVRVGTTNGIEASETLRRHYPLVRLHRGHPVTIGQLTVEANTRQLVQRLLNRSWTLLLTSLLTTLLLGALIYLLVHQRITRHLEEMATFTRTTAPEDLETPLLLDRDGPQRERDELSELSDAFNQMRATLNRLYLELRDSEARYRELFDISPVALWEKDVGPLIQRLARLPRAPDELRAYCGEHPEELERLADLVRVVSVNQATERLFRATGLGELTDTLGGLRREGGEQAFIEKLITLAEGARHLSCESTTTTLDGKSRHLLIHWIHPSDDDPKVDRVIESQMDISGLKRTQSALSAAKEEAEQANRAKSEFLATMSHEIRTPMNAIMGMTDVLAEKIAHGEEVTPYLDVVQRNGRALLNLINDILDVSKLDAGGLRIENTPFDLVELVEGVVEAFQVVTKEKGIRIVAAIGDDTPPPVRHRLGDSLRLRQVLINLLGNAVKFTHQGQVTVNVEQSPDGPQRLAFSITDTGIGIPDEKLATVFDLFSQAEGSTTRGYGGTGLGLYLCRSLVDAMGGELEVESQVGLGSCFHFALPLPIDQARRDHAPTTTAPSDGDAASLEGLRVLMAEDAEDNVLLIRVYLKRSGIQLDVARDGREALELFRRQPYDLVLMDMQMPVMDGFTATREIRDWERRQARPPTPIMALTAYTLKGDQEKCLEAGCDRYLTKPVKKARLMHEMGALAVSIQRDPSAPRPPSH